jgi:hypothetical protein
MGKRVSGAEAVRSFGKLITALDREIELLQAKRDGLVSARDHFVKMANVPLSVADDSGEKPRRRRRAVLAPADSVVVVQPSNG